MVVFRYWCSVFTYLNINLFFDLHSWQARSGIENMAEPRRESTSSLQRKKPPWLRLDIPTAQMSLDEPPTFVQVLPLSDSLFTLTKCLSQYLSPLSFAVWYHLCTYFSDVGFSCIAGETAGFPSQYQHAGGDFSPPVSATRDLWHPAACITTPIIHYSDHKEVGGGDKIDWQIFSWTNKKLFPLNLLKLCMNVFKPSIFDSNICFDFIHYYVLYLYANMYYEIHILGMRKIWVTFVLYTCKT